MSDLIRLEIEGRLIDHVEDDDGTPLYPGFEVADAFGFSNPRRALIEHVDNDDVRFRYSVDSNGRRYKKKFITGIGVQTLAFRSKLPKPREYTRRVAAHMEAIRLGKVTVQAERDLATKVAAFIAEKTREWELTFKSDYYAHLDRLSGFKRSHPNKHPQVYGLVTSKIYELLDPDIADQLRVLIPHPTKGGPKRHQALSDFGRTRLKEILLGELGTMAACSTLKEYLWYLDEKIAKQQRLPLRLVNGTAIRRIDRVRVISGDTSNNTASGGT